MYKEHQGAQSIVTTVTENDDFENSITVSASVKNNKTLVTIGNLSCTEDVSFSLESVGEFLPEKAEATLLFADDMHAHNTFDCPENVTPADITINLKEKITIPKAGIMAIRF